MAFIEASKTGSGGSGDGVPVGALMTFSGEELPEGYEPAETEEQISIQQLNDNLTAYDVDEQEYTTDKFKFAKSGEEFGMLDAEGNFMSFGGTMDMKVSGLFFLANSTISNINVKTGEHSIRVIDTELFTSNLAWSASTIPQTATLTLTAQKSAKINLKYIYAIASNSISRAVSCSVKHNNDVLHSDSVTNSSASNIFDARNIELSLGDTIVVTVSVLEYCELVNNLIIY